MKFWIFVFFGLLLQTDHSWTWMANAVQEKYPEVKSETGSYYEIDLQDHIPVVLYLTRQQDQYYGAYAYYKDQNPYILSGEKSGSYIHLTEWDNHGSASGLISFNLSGDTLEGIWSNLDRSIEMTLRGKEIQSITKYQWPSWNNWLKVYESKIITRPYHLVIQKEKIRLSGTFYDGIQGKTFSINGKCQDLDCNQFTLKLKDLEQADTKMFGKISGQLEKDNYVFLTYTQPDGNSNYISLSQAQSHELVVDMKLNYFSLFDISYPFFSNTNANRDITNFIQNQYSRSGKPDRDEKISNSRLRHQLYIWPESLWFNERFYSGNIWAQHYAKDTLIAFNFNFDLRQNRTITLDQIFKRSVDGPAMIQDQLRQILTKRNYDQSEEYSTDDFTFFNLLPEGILMSTQFSPGYGSERIVIPYSEFGNQINRKYLQEYLAN